MTKTVVDVLETIQIKHQQRQDTCRAPLRQLNAVLGPLTASTKRFGSARGRGEKEIELQLRTAQLGQVGQHRSVIADPAVWY